jgi:hypothetical protein
MVGRQSRPLDPVYPVILIEAIVLEVREGTVANRPVLVAMVTSLDGKRDVLGMWVGPSGGEGAKHWLGMPTELQNLGVADARIASCTVPKAYWRRSRRPGRSPWCKRHLSTLSGWREGLAVHPHRRGSGPVQTRCL